VDKLIYKNMISKSKFSVVDNQEINGQNNTTGSPQNNNNNNKQTEVGFSRDTVLLADRLVIYLFDFYG